MRTATSSAVVSHGFHSELLCELLCEFPWAFHIRGSLWVALRKHRVALPWRWVLRCPCLVFSATLLAVLGLIGIGVTSAPISLNTNFAPCLQELASHRKF